MEILAKHISLISSSLGITQGQIRATIKLLMEGATIPFIARYRKEVTGELDEVAIAEIKQQWQRLEEAEKRREVILQRIAEQGKLTDELRERILATYNLTELEDLYLPYRPKRRTRASIAREKGLQPLADMLIAQQEQRATLLAKAFISEQVPSIEDALQGARDIIAEFVNEDEGARTRVRRAFADGAYIKSKVVKGKDAEGIKYKDYFALEEPLSKCPSHRLLAMRRGEDEGFLRLIVSPDDEATAQSLEPLFVRGVGPASEQVREAVRDSYDRLLAPSIETTFRNTSKDKADEEAIRVFAENLRQLLLAAPLGQRSVMGIDPGFRSGCKVVCLDTEGNLKHYEAVFPHQPQNETRRTEATLKSLVIEFDIEAVAIGNGTAGRETENVIRGIDFGRKLDIFMVNEAGASIYSASEVARDEFPDYDLTVRGAVSIGRRLMDPLAELVKIDPKSIGVGQYQHDVNQNALKAGLDTTVESCVNRVGVNLNTASKHLLTYISGLGPSLAQNIIAHRTQNGPFKRRSDLKKVARLGEKAYEQCAGFLRIRTAEQPLDNTAVHPESYHIVEQMAKDAHCTVANLIENSTLRRDIKLQKYVTAQVGMPTLLDIMRELDKPGLDPRGQAKTFQFANIHGINDLHEGMIVPGIVTNITNFGAFVDIGVKQDGLVHVSQMANRFVRNPTEVVKLQQHVNVKIVEVDTARKRIMLTMKGV